MRPFRLPLSSLDVPVLTLGAFATLAAALASIRLGSGLDLGLVLGLTIFFAFVVGFIAFPHVAIALTIPIFCIIPALRVLAIPWIGPLKEFILLAALTAVGVLLVQRAREGVKHAGDFWVAALILFLIGLYLLNLGGGMQRNIAWAHGVRLFSEPLLLLLVGISLEKPTRMLKWAMWSLVLSAVFVALVGISQQVVGPEKLDEIGYSYTIQIREINGHLRSFGTMDESFGYAALLLLGLVAVFMWMRRGIPAFLAGSVIALGLLFSYVRTALVIVIALLGLCLWRSHRPAVAGFLLALAVASAGVILVRSSSGTQAQTIRTGPSLYLTINGRTEGWKVVLDSPRTWAIGKGVGKVGTAAERATYSVSRKERDEARVASAVDSGYFAIIADIGFVGLVALLALLARLVMLSWASIARAPTAGWLGVGFILVIVLDAVTRDSFTGFPTAFLGFLFVGLAVAAGAEASEKVSSPVPDRA